MSDLPNFAVILPLAFLAFGALILLWGLSYARPPRFDERSLRRWRRKLAMVSFIPYSTSRSDAEIEELTGVFRRQQCYFLIGGGVGLTCSSLALLVGVLVAPEQALITSLFGSSYGIAILATVSILVMAIGVCLGYALQLPPLSHCCDAAGGRYEDGCWRTVRYSPGMATNLDVSPVGRIARGM